MKRLFILLFFSSTMLNIAFAQSDIYQIRQAMDFFRLNQLQTGELKNFLTEKDISGSPYLQDEFANGTVYTTTKQQFVDIPLRYNIYNDQMEFKTPDNKIQAMASPETVERIKFNNIEMIYVPFSNVKKIRKGFFRVVEKGNASLLSRSEVIFKDAEEPGAYKEAVPPRFQRKPDSYYVKVGEEQAKRVNSKKELVGLFPAHKNELTSYIKKNKVKTNKEESLIALVRYYNSL